MNTCFHCHNALTEIILFDNKSFCCEGCKTVYEIINDNALEDYYAIDDKLKAIRPKIERNNFTYLDINEFQEKFLSFNEGDISRVSFFLPQIHCSSCLWLLERLPSIDKGVIQSQVNFGAKTVEITFNNQLTKLSAIAFLLATIGYPPDISLNDKKEKKSSKQSLALTKKIGVAGFCFGNIMLLSFPEYLGLKTSEGDFQLVFNSLNLLLSIPVLFYCSSDYLKSAYIGIKRKYINIDIPISIGIIAFYAQSVFEIISGQGTGYLDSFAGLIFFLLIGKWFQQTTYGAINFDRDYNSYFPIAVAKIVDEKETTIALKDVLIDDVLLIRNNELIPADAVLIDGKGSIDYSFVSGESSLITKNINDKLFAGGRQMGQAIQIKVTKKIENSYLTQLWNNPIFDKEKINRSFTDNITKYFTLSIIIIAISAAIFWYFVDPSKSIFSLVSVLIIACPCAIALSVPFTYGNGIRVLSKNDFYLRSTSVIENVAGITDIIFDKTGTITLSNQSQITWHGRDLLAHQNAAIFQLTNQSAHPLSRLISSHLKSELSNKDIIQFKELPGKGIQGTVESNEYFIGSALFVGDGQPIIGTSVHVKMNDEYLGYFKFNNVFRPGVADLFMQLGKKYKLHILSGDGNSELENLKKVVPTGSSILFNQQPTDKLNYIEKLQDNGAKVMMLGDGLNDAGALKKADVGISVVDDVYSFSPASDAIMQGEKLTTLELFIEYCNYNKSVVKLSYAFSILYNLVGLSFALSGTLTPLIAAVLMPISSISVVILVTLLTNIRGKRIFKR